MAATQRVFLLVGLASLVQARPMAAQGLRPLPLQIDPRAAPSAARLHPFVLFDSAFGRSRRIWVYTPPGYDPSAATVYPLLLAFDGAEYQDTVPLPLILDTLQATRRAPAFVGILVDDSSSGVRIADLGNAHRMADFLARQLIPWARARWHVTTDPHRVIVTGSSAGGLAAAFVALRHPELFGNVLSQSGAFWRGAEGSDGAPYEWLTAELGRMPRQEVEFVLDVGEFEDHATIGGRGPNFRDANRRFRDALVARGYPVVYTEVPGGQHGPQYWTTRLPVGLVTLTSGWH